MKSALRISLFASAIVVILLVKSLSPRRDLRVSTDPRWTKVVQFVRSASEVTTFATKSDIDSETALAEALQASPNSGVLRIVTDRKRLIHHLAVLPQMPGVDSPVAACFCPHHFVYAKNGSADLRIDICYKCGSCRVQSKDKDLRGSFPIESDTQSDSGAVFGLDVEETQKRSGCRYFASD